MFTPSHPIPDPAARPSGRGQFMSCFLGGVLLAGLLVLSVVFASPPVESVARVDVSRYAGVWYELARLPNRFQASCVSDVSADYVLMRDGSLTVVNRCREEDGRMRVVKGRATPAQESGSGARWKLGFLPSWLQWLPLGRSDYWVVMLDPDYRFAVVSEPTREFLWILSRTPRMDDAAYIRIVEQLQRAGYPVEKLVRTPHQATSTVARLSRML